MLSKLSHRLALREMITDGTTSLCYRSSATKKTYCDYLTEWLQAIRLYLLFHHQNAIWKYGTVMVWVAIE